MALRCAAPCRASPLCAPPRATLRRPLRRPPPARPCRAASSDGGQPTSSSSPSPPPVSPQARTLEALRASLAAPGGLPFVTDAALVADDVRYEGPLCSLRGRDAYLATQRDWARNVPARLPGWTVKDGATLFALSPAELRLRCAPRFGAAMPPRAEERLLAAGEALPARRPQDNLIDARLQLTAELSLDAQGRVVRHTERCTDGFGVLATISRYNWLTSRRPATELSPVWYAQVLRYTSLEEAAAAAGTTSDDESLQQGFIAMVSRNFGAGVLIGVAIYAAIKAARLALLYAAAAPPQL